LDLLGPFGLDLAIVTHWDNAEGGTHDTRACFMGLERFGVLRRMLPPGAVVLGVDEHTACTLDLEAGRAEVRGRGGVTILRGEDALRHEAGEGFPLAELASHATAGAQGLASLRDDKAAGSPDALLQAATLIAEGDLPSALRLAAEGAEAGLAAILHQAAQSLESRSANGAAPDRLIDLLVEARSALREDRQWALADRLRDGLTELGIEIQDTPEKTHWGRRPTA
jgi:hypothetical protein